MIHFIFTLMRGRLERSEVEAGILTCSAIAVVCSLPAKFRPDKVQVDTLGRAELGREGCRTGSNCTGALLFWKAPGCTSPGLVCAHRRGERVQKGKPKRPSHAHVSQAASASLRLEVKCKITRGFGRIEWPCANLSQEDMS